MFGASFGFYLSHEAFSTESEKCDIYVKGLVGIILCVVHYDLSRRINMLVCRDKNNMIYLIKEF